MKLENIRKELEAMKTRSAWAAGVKEYAIELLERLEEWEAGGYFNNSDLTDRKKLHSALLNGADNWKEYSWGGCSLIYDRDIAERLCTPSELKKTRNGERKPNKSEEWLDTQARALFQAEAMINKIIEKVGA